MKYQYNLSEIKLSYMPRFKLSDRPIVKDSRTAYEILLQHWDAGKMLLLEEFKIILLNNASRVLGIVNIAQGGITSVSVDLQIMFATTLKANASSIIMAHNHPSGTLKPSTQDILLTDKVRAAASIFGIRILDHLIITPESYFSFLDDGLMEES